MNSFKTSIVELNLTLCTKYKPSSLRFSGTSAMPFFIASIGELIVTFLPSRYISPVLFGISPNILFITSLLPAPTNPAKPNISPFLSSKLTFSASSPSEIPSHRIITSSCSSKSLV